MGAWTEPDRLARWHHPEGVSNPRESVEVDLREGGRYSYTMVDDTTGEQYPTAGVYRTVEPPHRLVFTWASPDDAPEDSPVVDVTFTEADGGTELTLVVRGIAGQPGDENVYDGWNQALDSLERHLRG